ncbi:MAG: GTPase HflX [Magnetococcales bacterium]|nr:GTPase HflX [Magnetococcales bacterium]
MENAILVQSVRRDVGLELAQLQAQELSHLASTAGLVPVETLLVPQSDYSPSLFLGKGRLQGLIELIEQRPVDVVLFNHALSPVQQRNLERRLNVKVVDRTGIILEIFAARAQTREGCLQVELASLIYQQSRLVRSWTHLERQRGGVGLRGGPGETQIEVDRRLIRERIHILRAALKQVERTRGLHRSARRADHFLTVALVGYTNAGKSTLFNRLTGAEVMAEDKLFATLDPTMRRVDLPGGLSFILADTVGFIRDLPHQLVAAFRATLEELVSADLLLHLVDISHPEWQQQIESVQQVLEELGAEDKPLLTVCNKIDRLPPDELAERRLLLPDSIAISAGEGHGIDALRQAIVTAMSRDWPTFRLAVPVTEGALLVQLQQQGRVLHHQEQQEQVILTVALPPPMAGRLQTALKKFACPA